MGRCGCALAVAVSLNSLHICPLALLVGSNLGSQSAARGARREDGSTAFSRAARQCGCGGTGRSAFAGEA
eukprot:151074-Chlamydomonas_euryale.AAC.2